MHISIVISVNETISVQNGAAVAAALPAQQALESDSDVEKLQARSDSESDEENLSKLKFTSHNTYQNHVVSGRATLD